MAASLTPTLSEIVIPGISRLSAPNTRILPGLPSNFGTVKRHLPRPDGDRLDIRAGVVIACHVGGFQLLHIEFQQVAERREILALAGEDDEAALQFVRKLFGNFQVHSIFADGQDTALAVEGPLPIHGEVLERDVARVVEHERGDKAVKDELRALAVDLQVLQAEEREGNTLQAFVVVADEEILLHRPIGPEVVTPGGEAEPGGFRPPALLT